MHLPFCGNLIFLLHGKPNWLYQVPNPISDRFSSLTSGCGRDSIHQIRGNGVGTPDCGFSTLTFVRNSILQRGLRLDIVDSVRSKSEKHKRTHTRRAFSLHFFFVFWQFPFWAFLVIRVSCFAAKTASGSC